MRSRALALSFGALVVAGLIGATSRGRSEDPLDPLQLYPGNYRVLLDNDRVRVLDFRLAKGATEKMHRHPAHVAVFLGEFRIQFTLPDGSTAIRDAHFGDVAYSDGAMHSSENVGSNDAHGILIEFKQ